MHPEYKINVRNRFSAFKLHDSEHNRKVGCKKMQTFISKQQKTREDASVKNVNKYKEITRK